MSAKLISWGFCFLGLVLSCHPMILSGLRLMQTDPGDTRLNHYILEHSFRWITGALPGSYWNPPVFFPVPNTIAYTDLLLGSAPLYWFWRVFPLAPDSAYQLWMLTILSLNFWVAYLFFQNCFQIQTLASSLAAYLFAFGSPRICQMGHQQLLVQFYTLIVFYALFKLFKNLRSQRSRPRAWIFILCMAASLQVYSGFYMGWFLGIFLMILGIWGMVFSATRKPLWRIFKNYPLTWLSAMVLSGFLLYPMATHYLAVAQQNGYRDFLGIWQNIPPLQSWIYLGPQSWLYNWTQKIKAFAVIDWGEQRLGIGLFTSVIVFWGLWRERHQVVVRLVLLSALTIFFITTRFPFPQGGSSLWTFLYPWIPGAGAIRALSRVGIPLLIPASIGLGFYFQKLKPTQASTWIFAFLMILEQGQTTQAYDKLQFREEVHRLASQIDPAQCKVFFYSPIHHAKTTPLSWRYQLDAMWAQMETHVPTLNGYSGNIPPAWPLNENEIFTSQDEIRLQQALYQWMSVQSLDASGLCWIRIPL